MFFIKVFHILLKTKQELLLVTFFLKFDWAFKRWKDCNVTKCLCQRTKKKLQVITGTCWRIFFSPSLQPHCLGSWLFSSSSAFFTPTYLFKTNENLQDPDLFLWLVTCFKLIWTDLIKVFLMWVNCCKIILSKNIMFFGKLQVSLFNCFVFSAVQKIWTSFPSLLWTTESGGFGRLQDSQTGYGELCWWVWKQGNHSTLLWFKPGAR